MAIGSIQAAAEKWGSDWVQHWIHHGIQQRWPELPLRIQFWNDREISLAADPVATLKILKPAGIYCLLRPSLSRIGSAYVEGLVDFEGSPRNYIPLLEKIESHGSTAKRRWRPRKRTKRADQKAVQYHYDVSNDFYKIFLDEQMVYSCAYFREQTQTLEQAQQEKLDLICRKLLLKPGEEFLDIGCGWGALLCWAAKNYGVRATGITVSERQYEFTRERIRREGLQDKCEVLFRNYRDLNRKGAFDKIASVGMFEHVGLAHMNGYFGSAYDLLREGGMMLNHGICSSELDQGLAGGGDCGAFMERYVFPYGELPHVSFAARSMASQNFELVDVESLRPHYARTLSEWLSRLEFNEAEIRRTGGDRRYRIWRVYLAGCIHGFERGWISIYQLLAVKPHRTGEWKIPQTRDHLLHAKSTKKGSDNSNDQHSHNQNQDFFAA